MRRTVAALALLLTVGATGCLGRGHHQTAYEVQAERLVQLQAGEDVTCRDSHAVNRDVVPDASGYFICRNRDGEVYAAVVAPDGSLASLSGPAQLKD
jgi:hypothetical protein